jgi:signal transduction histidine kinase
VKTDTPKIVWKRLAFFGSILLFILFILDQSALRSILKEEKTKIVLNGLKNNNIIYDNLNVFFGGVEHDFDFLEKEIIDLLKFRSNRNQYQSKVNSLITFLETHPGYYKVRLVNSLGKEQFKLAQNRDHSHFEESKNFDDLSKQFFFKDMNKVQIGEFFFSSMEANIVGGKREIPLRPTVRVSKRIIKNNEIKLLIFNIDGQRIFDFFNGSKFTFPLSNEKALLDGSGYYIAEAPQREKELYLLKRKALPDIISKIQKMKEQQGSIELPEELIVFSKIILPNTTEQWFLINRYTRKSWQENVLKKRLSWILWGLSSIFIFLMLFWKQEKKRYEDEVVKVLLSERSEFNQNVSHQLKTPLAILTNTLSKVEVTKQDISDVNKEIRHLAKVVDDMLILALVDTGPQLPLRPENIMEIIINAIEMTGNKAREKNVMIHFNVEESLHESTQGLERPAMSDLLSSAIMNIIDNAIDFSPWGETIEVNLSSYHSKLIIRIKDNGPGISDELLLNIFKRFSRGDTTRKGSGLGLSISKKIIELHNGEIKIIEHKNGVTFDIYI